MASLSPNSVLSSLISTGSDATLNLFTVEIPIFDTMEGVFFRIQNFRSPKRNSSTVNYNYRNLQVTQVAPSTDISRTVDFNIRLDSNYELLYLLRKYQCTDNLGNFTKTDKCIQEVTVTAYSSQLNSNGNYTPVYQWKLKNCYIVSISEISYGYDSSNTTNVTVNMVYGDFTEGEPVNVEEQQGDNSSYYENQKAANKNVLDKTSFKKSSDAFADRNTNSLDLGIKKGSNLGVTAQVMGYTPITSVKTMQSSVSGLGLSNLKDKSFANPEVAANYALKNAEVKGKEFKSKRDEAKKEKNKTLSESLPKTSTQTASYISGARKPWSL